jgi:hypothetical protein
VGPFGSSTAPRLDGQVSLSTFRKAAVKPGVNLGVDRGLWTRAFLLTIMAADGADIRDEQLEGSPRQTTPTSRSSREYHRREVMFRDACSIGLEGIVSKRRDSTYGMQ